MICFWIRMQISAAIDEGRQLSKLVRRHIQKCPACRQFDESCRSLETRLSGDADDLEVPGLSKLRQAVLKRCRENTDMPARPIRRPGKIFKPAAAAAILIAIALTATITINHTQSPPTALLNNPTPSMPETNIAVANNSELIIWLIRGLGDSDQSPVAAAKNTISQPVQTGELGKAGEDFFSEYVLALVPFKMENKINNRDHRQINP